MRRGSRFDCVHWEREEQGVQSRPEKRASKPTPDAGLVFGSQEILCFPAGQVTTFASQSISNALLSKPALSRDCQLGSCATGPMISTPFSCLLATSTLASVYPLSTM